MRACQLCLATTHVTDECLDLDLEEVKILGHNPGNGGNGGNGHRKYDPNSQFHNPRWRDHENFKYSNNNYLGPKPQYQQQGQALQQPRFSLADMVNIMANENLKNQAENKNFK